MFKRSRRKIVAAIMSVLVLLWVGTLGVIYASSYIEMTQRNRQMLMEHTRMYALPQAKEELPPAKEMPDMQNPGFMDTPVFQLSTFYTVALTYDGEILDIKNEQPALHTDEELEQLAKAVIEEDKIEGTKKNLAYYLADKGEYLVVAFMDNTIIHESAATLLRYTLLFGGVAMLLFFFVAVYLARKIVQPLEESYQKQKRFISDAGHELKTPVAVVSTNAELLAREIGENQWLSNIRYENERMGILVGQLLELTRAEHVLPQMESMDFNRLVNGEALPFEGVAFEKGITLECEVANGITVEGNAAQLKQLVSILLDNALSHSRSGSKVQLTVKKEHGTAKLSVINEGEEIPPEQRAKIFERFYRVDEARTGEEHHYGLGLSIAKAIVVAHKGKIDVCCHDGKIEFQVQLPMKNK